MRKAIREKWTALSEYTSSSSTRSTTYSSSSSGSSGSYSYYSEGSGSYYASYSPTRASTATSSEDTASTAQGDSDSSSAATVLSAVASSHNSNVINSNNNSDEATSPASATSSSNSPPRSTPDSNAAASSLASSSDAIVKKPTTKRGLGTSSNQSEGHASTSATTTTFNGITIDASDALVPQRTSSTAGSAASSPTSPLTSANRRALVLPRSSLDPAAPASPYHFSEEELARQPWTVEGCDATTHTSEEGGGLVPRAADVMATIHTVPVPVPPPAEESQRRRREGGLPYPSHLTFRILPNAGAPPAESTAADGAKSRDGAAKSSKDDAAKPRARKTVCDACFGGYFYRKREKARQAAEERAAARQRSYHNQLRSHHVPLVNFRTTRDQGVNIVDGDTVLPTVEEAAGYRQYVEDMKGAEAEPKKLQHAMRQRRRPGSGLHLKTKYAYGRRAGGGPRGVGESAFAREGDPQRFWIAQLHERSQVHLEAIETQ